MSEGVEQPPLGKSVRHVKTLLDECKYRDASRFCYKCIKNWPDENLFYRVKVYCDLQLSRWHSCLETIGWLHGYHTHPLLSIPRSKKRKQSSQNIQQDEKSEKNENLVRNATRVHCEGDKCLWLHFEQSYCYYKLGKYHLGLKALKMCSEDLLPRDLLCEKAEDLIEFGDAIKLGPKFLLLRAQLFMRLDRLEEAKAIYGGLRLKQTNGLLDVNILSIDLALMSNLDSEKQLTKIEELEEKFRRIIEAENLENYELYYNWACARILAKDYSGAQKYLDLSEGMLKDELKNELEGDVIMYQPELANVLALRAFLHAKVGNIDLAKKINKELLENFLESRDVDQSVMLVALTNQLWLSEDYDANIYKAIKLILRCEAVVGKFSPQDLREIYANCIWSLISSGKLDEASSYLSSQKGRMLNISDSGGMLDFYLYSSLIEFMRGNINSCMSTIRLGIKAVPPDKKVILLECMLRVMLKSKLYKDALSIAELRFDWFLEDVDHLLNYFSIVLEMHIQLKSPAMVIQTLNKLCQHISTKNNGLKKSQEKKFRDLVVYGSGYLESQKLHQDAKSFYELLYKRDTTDMEIICGVLYNGSFLKGFGGVEIPGEFESLILKDIRYIDPEELETESKVYFHLEHVEDPDRDTVVTRKKRKKRKKRPGKLPKNAHLCPNPDPERWLHKYERLAYKKISKKRKDANRGQIQGSLTSNTSTKPSTVAITTDSSTSNRRRRKKGPNR